MNQTISLPTLVKDSSHMNFTRGDVCYWEFFIDPEEFLSKHTFATGKLSEVFINIALDLSPSNLLRFALQGTSKYNSTSVNLSSSPLDRGLTRFPLSNGSRVYLVASPLTPVVPLLSMLTFTFNLSTPYYPV
jgi:hypothetical protein